MNSSNSHRILVSYFKEHCTHKAELDRLLNVKTTAFLRYQKRDRLQTSLLLNISHALKDNFFMDIAQELSKEYTSTKSSPYLQKMS